jgi:hypothetical protein
MKMELKVLIGDENRPVRIAQVLTWHPIWEWSRFSHFEKGSLLMTKNKKWRVNNKWKIKKLSLKTKITVHESGCHNIWGFSQVWLQDSQKAKLLFSYLCRHIILRWQTLLFFSTFLVKFKKKKKKNPLELVAGYFQIWEKICTKKCWLYEKKHKKTKKNV